MQGLTRRLAPKKAKSTKHKRGKHGGKKEKSKLKCFDCGKEVHFACECTEPKKVLPNFMSCVFMLLVMLWLLILLLKWIVDSASTKHVTRVRGTWSIIAYQLEAEDYTWGMDLVWMC
jgi:hypothetical protein